MDSITIKPDISDFVNSLRRKYSQLWWPKYLFHYTDIENVGSILKNRCLYSRQKALQQQLLNVDCAGQEVLNYTNRDVMEYVRLYFRPKTPPLWHKEGFRPFDRSGEEFPEAHCPVPVYFLFDSKTILSLDCVAHRGSEWVEFSG